MKVKKNSRTPRMNKLEPKENKKNLLNAERDLSMESTRTDPIKNMKSIVEHQLTTTNIEISALLQDITKQTQFSSGIILHQKAA